MEITLAFQNDKTLEIQLDGRLDTDSAPVLSAKIQELPEGVTTIILDLARLRYISSAGLRVLIQIKKKLDEVDGELVIRNADNRILDVFSMTGFDSLLKIE